MGLKPILFAACDFLYFQSHAIAFTKSGIQHNMPVCIVVSPTKTMDYAYQLGVFEKFVKGRFAPSFSEEERKLILSPKFLDYFYDIDTEDERTYFSILRFFEAAKVIEQTKCGVLILDIDSIVNQEFTINEDIQLGLYLREGNITGKNAYEIEGMKVAAGAVYVTPESLPFLSKVNSYFFDRKLRWFADQHAIYSAWKEDIGTYSFQDFSETRLIDWEFEENTSIWTGKGQRKYNNKTYLKKKEIYDADIRKEFPSNGDSAK